MWFELSKRKPYQHLSEKFDPIIALFSESRLQATYLFSLRFNIMKYHSKLDILTAAKGQILVAHKINISIMYQSITFKNNGDGKIIHLTLIERNTIIAQIKTR